MSIDEGRRVYAELSEYVSIRTKELLPMLQPFLTITDRYGELICEIVLILGRTPPASKLDAALRDLVADVFQFLTEARPLISKGMTVTAYPLARRAYESLSLMVASYLNAKLAERWMAGKQIGNAEVRRSLGTHPMGEPELNTKELYNFFSKTTHPNRSVIAHRYLGDGNQFVLGAIGVPSLSILADYAIKTLDLWLWFGAFVIFVYLEVLSKADPEIVKEHSNIRKEAITVRTWLIEQFDRVLAQEREMNRDAQLRRTRH